MPTDRLDAGDVWAAAMSGPVPDGCSASIADAILPMVNVSLLFVVFRFENVDFTQINVQRIDIHFHFD